MKYKKIILTMILTVEIVLSGCMNTGVDIIHTEQPQVQVEDQNENQAAENNEQHQNAGDANQSGDIDALFNEFVEEGILNQEEATMLKGYLGELAAEKNEQTDPIEMAIKEGVLTVEQAQLIGDRLGPKDNDEQNSQDAGNSAELSNQLIGNYDIVDTSQTAVDGNHGGQDAHYFGNQPSYKDNGDGTVTDTVTGLTWQQGFSLCVHLKKLRILQTMQK